VSELSTRPADEVVDCTGSACPLPVLQTAQALRNLAPGQTLELLATDPGVEPDMRAWCSRTGNELLGITRQAEVFHVFIRCVR